MFGFQYMFHDYMIIQFLNDFSLKFTKIIKINYADKYVRVFVKIPYWHEKMPYVS